MLFVSLGSISMRTYLPNPIWRPSAILVRSSSLFLTYIIFMCNSFNVTNFGMQNSFLMLFSSLGSIHMLSYLPNPIWRPSAILEKSSSLFLTPFSRVIPLMLLILVCGIHFWCYFIIGVNTHAYLLTKSNMAAVGHIGIVIFVSYTIFTCSTSKVTNFGM